MMFFLCSILNGTFLEPHIHTSLTPHDSHCPYIILTKSDTSCPLLIFISLIYMSPLHGRRIFHALISGLSRGLSPVNESTGNKPSFLSIFPGPLIVGGPEPPLTTEETVLHRSV